MPSHSNTQSPCNDDANLRRVFAGHRRQPPPPQQQGRHWQGLNLSNPPRKTEQIQRMKMRRALLLLPSSPRVLPVRAPAGTAHHTETGPDGYSLWCSLETQTQQAPGKGHSHGRRAFSNPQHHINGLSRSSTTATQRSFGSDKEDAFCPLSWDTPSSE